MPFVLDNRWNLIFRSFRLIRALHNLDNRQRFQTSLRKVLEVFHFRVCRVSFSDCLVQFLLHVSPFLTISRSWWLKRLIEPYDLHMNHIHLHQFDKIEIKSRHGGSFWCLDRLSSPAESWWSILSILILLMFYAANRRKSTTRATIVHDTYANIWISCHPKCSTQSFHFSQSFPHISCDLRLMDST